MGFLLRSAAIILAIASSTAGLQLPTPVAASAAAYVGTISEWIMGLDIGSGEVQHYDHDRNTLNASIFINGNLARVLMGSYRLTKNQSHLDEALRWCDSFVGQQVSVTTSKVELGGFWGVGYPRTDAHGNPIPLRDGNIYLGDTGTAVTALSLCHELTPDEAQRAKFFAAMTKYFHFVVGGCTTPGCGNPVRGGAPANAGFINASAGGAVGCGYYKGHLSTCPYVIATGTTGAAFGSEMLNIAGRQTATGRYCASMVGDAIGYMASLVSSDNGTIPYVLDCEGADWGDWPLDTLSYVTEGVVGAFIHAPETRPAIAKAFGPTVEWLLANQNSAGYWGSTAHAADLQRSPRVATLLSLWGAAAVTSGQNPDPRLGASLERYVRFLVANGNGAYGVLDILNTSGFVGLALIDMLKFGATFSIPKADL